MYRLSQKSYSKKIVWAIVGIAVAIAIVFGSTILSSLSQVQTQQRQPNILFILTDDLNISEMSSMPKVKELIGDRGTTFENHFVNVSLCCPSRTTILCGQYAHNTQVLSNGGNNGGFKKVYSLGIEKNMMPNWLQSGGYDTAHMGKYLNGYPNSAGDTYVPSGWKVWKSAIKGNAYNEYNYTLNENGRSVAYGDRPEDYGTDVYTGQAIDFIEQSAAAQKPFFIQLSVYAPHGPATPAPRHANLFPDAKAPRIPSFNEEDISDKPEYLRQLPLLTSERIEKIDALYRKRLQSLQAVDDAVVKLIDTLEKTGQLDNTYIFFTSDNGFHLGLHRTEGKQTPYEEDIRVPLLVRGPNIPSGKIQTEFTGNVDFAPTFAELAGISIPKFVDGRSIVPLLSQNSPSATKWRKVYLLGHWQVKGSSKDSMPSNTQQGVWEPQDSIVLEDSNNKNSETIARKRKKRRNRDNKTNINDSIPDFQGIRTKGHTYVEYVTGEKEFYDLDKDPYQLENLANRTEANILKPFADRLQELRSCKEESCRSIEEKPFSA